VNAIRRTQAAAQRAGRLQGERGISLIELLIAISITGVLLVPIGAAIYFGFHTTGATQNRVAETSGANLMASYFVPDVQTAIGAATNAPESPICGSLGGTVDLVLTGPDENPSASVSVSYYRGTGARAGYLYRRTCANGAVTSLARVASHVAQPPSFTCDTTGCVNFRSITATFVQGTGAAGDAYDTRLEAVRRGL
jgi:hypothetical protein